MNAPLYSTITLLTEVLVSTGVFYIFYSGYKYNRFPHKWAIGVLTYEVLVNISYMGYRMVTHDQPLSTESTFDIALAIVHGSLSFLMFFGLIIFLALAWKGYNNGINTFKKHSYLTVLFLFLWLLAVGSGVLFYFVEYL